MSEFIMKASTDELAEFCRRYSNMQELVRCKDCGYGKPLLDENAIDENTIKYSHLFECNKIHDWCTDNIECHDGNWFCADGERRKVGEVNGQQRN